MDKKKSTCFLFRFIYFIHFFFMKLGFWKRFIVDPFSFLLENLSLLFYDNYGLAIIFLTLCIRFFLLYPSFQIFKNERLKKKVRPQLKKLREKRCDNRREYTVKKQQLYVQYGIKPMSLGCILLLFKLIFLLALLHAIETTEGISSHHFLWFELGSRDYILPFVAGGFSFLQFHAKLDEKREKVQIISSYALPILITVSAFFLPSVFGLYWVTSNLFLTFQNLWFRMILRKKASLL